MDKFEKEAWHLTILSDQHRRCLLQRNSAEDRVGNYRVYYENLYRDVIIEHRLVAIAWTIVLSMMCFISLIADLWQYTLAGIIPIVLFASYNWRHIGYIKKSSHLFGNPMKLREQDEARR